MASPIAPSDDGLSPERTVLAWNRTGMAFLIVVAALGRRVWPLDRGNHAAIMLVLGIAAFAFLASLWLAGRLRTRARYAGETLDPNALRFVSIGTLILAVAGFALALFPT